MKPKRCKHYMQNIGCTELCGMGEYECNGYDKECGSYEVEKKRKVKKYGLKSN